MTPEQAAEKAAAILDQAAAWANEPETTAALVNVADGWTRLHTALKMGQTELVTVNMSDTVIKDIDPKKVVAEMQRAMGYSTPSEPAEIADLPVEVHALVDAVNQMRDDWQGAHQKRRKELWYQVRRCSDATWRTCCNPEVV